MQGVQTRRYYPGSSELNFHTFQTLDARIYRSAAVPPRTPDARHAVICDYHTGVSKSLERLRRVETVLTVCCASQPSPAFAYHAGAPDPRCRSRRRNPARTLGRAVDDRPRTLRLTDRELGIRALRMMRVSSDHIIDRVLVRCITKSRHNPLCYLTSHSCRT